jgi:DNA-binding transcriptional MerR regulator
MDRGLRIGEVGRKTGLNPKTIRYYEEIGLIPPPGRREGGWASRGHRVFTADDVSRLEFIKRARLLDLSLKEIGDLLASVNQGCCGSAQPRLSALVEAKIADTDRKLADLRRLRKDLEGLRGRLAPRIAGPGPIQPCSEGATVSTCVFVEPPSRP